MRAVEVVEMDVSHFRCPSFAVKVNGTIMAYCRLEADAEIVAHALAADSNPIPGDDVDRRGRE